ncbi:MAG: ABC transporter substrate-binding protein [bacterium]|nr:ABC transporter substrate-binding protein [bacterium]
MKRVCLIAVAVLGLFVFGCAKKPIKIGVIVPLSGSISSYGDMCLKGIQLAIEGINKKGGINSSQVELLVEDDKGDPDAAETAIEKLDKAGVVAVIGPLTTTNVIKIAEYADKVGLPVITPSATGIDATRDRQWVWRISCTDMAQGIALATFAKEDLRFATACIIFDAGDPYSIGLTESFEAEFTKLGGKILLKTTITPGDTAFEAPLKVVKEQKPDFIVVPLFYNNAGILIKKARNMGFEQPFMGGDGLDSPELQKLVGNKKGAIYYSTHFFYNYGLAEVQDFLHSFWDKYGNEPQTFSALGFDATRIVEKTFVTGKECSRKAFKENIGKIGLTGATGIISFTENKDPRRSLMVLKFEPGKPIETARVF